MTEETFGPVFSVMLIANAEEGIAIANGTDFGLSGEVFGPRDRAVEVAKKTHGGAISINDAALTAIVHDCEKQAFKNSGLGPSRTDDRSITRFRRKRMLIENATLQHNPWWFPQTDLHD